MPSRSIKEARPFQMKPGAKKEAPKKEAPKKMAKMPKKPKY